jgi:hypothetical protein
MTGPPGEDGIPGRDGFDGPKGDRGENGLQGEACSSFMEFEYSCLHLQEPGPSHTISYKC